MRIRVHRLRVANTALLPVQCTDAMVSIPQVIPLSLFSIGLPDTVRVCNGARSTGLAPGISGAFLSSSRGSGGRISRFSGFGAASVLGTAVFTDDDTALRFTALI